MGRIIVTNTKVSKTPYVMEESGHCLYSYEELVYYIKTRMVLWLEEKTRTGLTAHMKEWGLMVENIDYLSPYEAAVIIFQASSYLREDEKEELLSQMEGYGEISQVYLEKEKGDLYLSYGRSRCAYLSYQKAVTFVEEEEDDRWKASLYHNFALACCRFFYWKEAKRWFALAIDARDNEKSRAGLEFVLEMESKNWFEGEGVLKEEDLEQKKEEFCHEFV